MKRKKPTATQNSASSRNVIASPLERVVDGGRDRRFGRRRADQALDVRHGGLFGRGDLLLGLGELAVELGLERLAPRLALGGEPRMRLARDRSPAAVGVGERLLISCERRVGLLAELPRLRRVRVLALL